ncbi:hypothetical protein CsSME_00040137 [Camellia sinensis var. sinensis]
MDTPFRFAYFAFEQQKTMTSILGIFFSPDVI